MKNMAKPKMGSGHSDVRRRKLTTKQKNTLLKKGKITVSIVGFKKTIRHSRDKNKANNVKKTATGWYYEWYRRSDRHYEPAVRAYHRDARIPAANRPSKARKRNYEGDFGTRT
jgi:hypothetical protein